MGIVSRLQHLHPREARGSEELAPTRRGRVQIAYRFAARLCSRCLHSAGTLLACLLLGLGLRRNVAAESAAIVFVVSMISPLVRTVFSIREVNGGR